MNQVKRLISSHETGFLIKMHHCTARSYFMLGQEERICFNIGVPSKPPIRLTPLEDREISLSDLMACWISSEYYRKQEM